MWKTIKTHKIMALIQHMDTLQTVKTHLQSARISILETKKEYMLIKKILYQTLPQLQVIIM